MIANKKIRISREIFFGGLFFVSLWVLYAPYWISSPYAIQGALALLLLDLGLFVFIPRPMDLFFLNAILIFISAYLGIQTIYFRAFQQIGRISTALSTINQVGAFTSSIVEFLKPWDLIFLGVPLFFLIASLLLSKARFRTGNRFFKLGLGFVLVLMGLYQTYAYYSGIEQSRNEYEVFLYYKTDHYIYTTIPSTNAFVSKFGMAGWLIRDIEKTFITPIFANTANEDRKISEMLANMDNPTSDEYSGLFKGKSLLVIEAESLNNFAIDPILTPTLYRLYANGMVASNYNSPLLFGSTSDAELMANTGLVPANDGYVTFHKYYENVFPQTLATVFNQAGYTSTAEHNNYGEFYNRNIVFPKFGYRFFDCIGMGFSEQFIEDSAYSDVLTWILVEEPKFLSYWITFNAHQPYGKTDLKESMIEDYNRIGEIYPDLPETERVYLAKNMDLDKGLANLLEVFSYSNRLDDLVIVLFGDHQPKGAFTNRNDFTKICNQKGYQGDACFDTPLIIWNNDSFVGRIDTVSSPIDISPTVYDLFGLKYDPKVMLGRSIFDPNNQGFYFDANGLIKTNDFTFDSIKKTLINNSNRPDSEVQMEADDLYTRLNLGYKIIENDYFASEPYQAQKTGE